MRDAQKITWTLSLAHALSSTAFLASATVTSIVGADLSGREELAGLPAAVFQLGVAAAALGLGFTMDRLGRRKTLSMGFVIGAFGAALAAWAIVARSFAGLLYALALMGPASAAAGLSRFVAAEVHPVHERGRAIATVVVGGTAGTIVWPLVSVVLGPFLTRWHVSEFVWPFGVSTVLLGLASVVLTVFLRPDPGALARTVAAPHDGDVPAAGGRASSLGEILLRPGARVAMTSMIAGHAIMVMVMVITPLHMRHHDHGVTAISITTSLHVLGMFAFSILSGRLADRYGRAPIIMAGAALLVLACLTAPLSPDVAPITMGLFLLGLGWNLCFVGGSSLLADQLSPDERARTQGFNDLLMWLVAAAGSFVSGQIFAAVGYRSMGVISAALAGVPFALALRWQIHAFRQRASASLGQQG